MEQIKIKSDFYEIFYNPYKELETNHFHKSPKAKLSWSVEVKFEVFSKTWTGGGSARYAQRRRATHWASQACANFQARYAHTVRSALGKRATRIISEPKKFRSFVQIHAKLPPTACK